MSLRVTTIIVFALSFLWLTGAASKEAKSLPGARQDINAVDYPSIQAALDAVPARGGLVILPAGIEASEPSTRATVTNNYFVDTMPGVDSSPVAEAATVNNVLVPPHN